MSLTVTQNKSLLLNNKNYDREEHRLYSFNNLKELPNIIKENLAKVGFYYNEQKNKIICRFCRVETRLFKNVNNAVEFHLKLNSTCPLIRRRHTSNVPCNVNELDKILPQPFNDICGTGIEFPTAKHPEYLCSSDRKKTFKHWMIRFLKVEDLVDSGFFYGNDRDVVECFCCGTTLGGWEEGDCPYQEHARNTEDCSYLSHVKGPTYIQSIKKKFNQN